LVNAVIHGLSYLTNAAQLALKRNTIRLAKAFNFTYNSMHKKESAHGFLMELFFLAVQLVPIIDIQRRDVPIAIEHDLVVKVLRRILLLDNRSCLRPRVFLSFGSLSYWVFIHFSLGVLVHYNFKFDFLNLLINI